MRHGFTLVELAIVLVIIGLLVGGVLVGRDLIKSSEYNAAITEFQSFVAAVNTFRTTYNAIPGDYSHATSTWGAADGNDGLSSDCRDAAATAFAGGKTCNGDGDGNLNYWPGMENFIFWQHLANQGLVSGNYVGSTTTTAPSKVTGAVWRATNYTPPVTNYFFLAGGNYGNSLGLGNDCSNSFGLSSCGVFTGAEMSRVDGKIDDGQAATGLVRPSWENQCANLVGGVYTYSMTASSTCGVIFLRAF